MSVVITKADVQATVKFCRNAARVGALTAKFGFKAGAAATRFALPLVIGGAKVGVQAIKAGAEASARAINWLSEQGQRELAKLEAVMEQGLTSYATPGELKVEFEERLKEGLRLTRKHSLLQKENAASARLLALRNSTLGDFLSIKEWQSILEKPSENSLLEAVLHKGVKRYAQAQTEAISQAVIEAAGEVGFKQKRKHRVRDDSQSLLIADSNGHAVKANLSSGGQGTELTLDLTGYTDGSCHTVMDKLIDALAKRDILIENQKRKSHYCATGSGVQKQSSGKKAAPKSEKQQPRRKPRPKARKRMKVTA